MRKIIMGISLASFVMLIASFVVQGLTKPEEFIQPRLPWMANLLLIIAGFVTMMIALCFYIVYWFQQERARERFFKKHSIIALSLLDVLRCEKEIARPYKRDVWLILALVIGLGLIMMAQPAMDLIHPHIDVTYVLMVYTGAPILIFMCAFLSRDLPDPARKIKAFLRKI